MIILAGVALTYVIGDNGVVTNAMKMAEETAKGELRDHLKLRLNEELVCASADISGTSQDIGTRYNEPALIYYLTGHQNFAGTDHAEENTKACIEEFAEGTNGVATIVEGLRQRTTDGPSKTIEVKTKYRVISKAVCPDGNKYGTGKNISDGNIFTLEAVGVTINDDKTVNTQNYEGKFELVYYDKDHNRTVLDTFSFYMTNQS